VTAALPPPPVTPSQRLRRAAAGVWAWSRDPGNRAAAVALWAIAITSLLAIALGLVLSGPYEGPPRTGLQTAGEALLMVGVLPWVEVAVIAAIVLEFWLCGFVLRGIFIVLEWLVLLALRLLPERPIAEAQSASSDPRDPAGYYALLEVDPRSPGILVHAAYRRLALKHHPDRGGDLRTMQDLNAAWAVLGDREHRAAYDRGRKARSAA